MRYKWQEEYRKNSWKFEKKGKKKINFKSNHLNRTNGTVTEYIQLSTPHNTL